MYIHYLYKKNFIIVTVLPLKKLYMLNESCCQVYSHKAWQVFKMAAIWVFIVKYTNKKHCTFLCGWLFILKLVLFCSKHAQEYF